MVEYTLHNLFSSCHVHTIRYFYAILRKKKLKMREKWNFWKMKCVFFPTSKKKGNAGRVWRKKKKKTRVKSKLS